MNAKTARSGRPTKADAGTRRGAAEAGITYTDEPIGDVQVIPDFLPSPSELAFREEGVKVTLALSRKSVEFFKAEAARHHTQYQRMIRRLLDAYVDAQARSRQSPGFRDKVVRGR